MSVTCVHIPEGHSIACGTFGEHPVLRMIYGGRWTAETADGLREYSPGEEGLALYFGPCTKMMPLIAHGSFRVTTINFTPGGSPNFELPDPSEITDRIWNLDPITRSSRPLPTYSPQDDAEQWLHSVEETLLQLYRQKTPEEPSDIISAFERFCLTDPGVSLDRFAESQSITRRTLERVIRRELGVTPKFALRRARALDMAAALLSVASAEEEPELRLRYYDESHLIREMHYFFDATPGQLQNNPHPLLTMTLEIRQSRRMETLARYSREELKPWRDPSSEPSGSVEQRAD